MSKEQAVEVLRRLNEMGVGYAAQSAAMGVGNQTARLALEGKLPARWGPLQRILKFAEQNQHVTQRSEVRFVG